METIQTKWPKKSREPLAAVSVHEIYPLEIFKARTGLAGWAMRMAQRNGLRVVKVGRRQFVRGVDFAEYLAGVAELASTDT